MAYIGQTPTKVPLTSDDIADGTISNADLAGSITSAKITSLDATKLTGTVAPARMGSGTASSTTVLYGDNTYKAEPTTDLTPLRQDIAMLALYNAVSDNRAAYNLPYSFIDQFEDDTGITTTTNVTRDTSSEFVASVIPADGIDTYTKLMLHMDDASLIDSSATGHTTTLVSGLTRSSTYAKFGTYSAFYDGSNDNMTIADSAEFTLGTSDFTFDYWFRNVGATGGYASSALETANDAFVFGYIHSDGEVQCFLSTNGSSWDIASAKSMGQSNPDGFSHHALVRNGSNFYTFKDGVQVETWTSSATVLDGTGLESGKRGGSYLDGYIDEMRFSVGIARWTSGFTPPTKAYSALVASATGTLISDTQTATGTVTKMSGVILYKDNAGTATLGTDLVIWVSANGGSNWTTAASYGAVTPLFSTGVKMVRIGETTLSHSGTAPVIKAVWANQAASSKETQLHGWAKNY